MGLDGAQLSKKNRTMPRQQQGGNHATPQSSPEEKSLPLAIGLNFVLPGLGYMYLGRPFLGVLAMLVVGFIFFTSGLLLLGQAWIGLNVLMALDMLILSNKRKKEISAATTTTCSECAETIKKAAKVCRFCGHKQ